MNSIPKPLVAKGSKLTQFMHRNNRKNHMAVQKYDGLAAATGGGSEGKKTARHAISGLIGRPRKQGLVASHGAMPGINLLMNRPPPSHLPFVCARNGETIAVSELDG